MLKIDSLKSWFSSCTFSLQRVNALHDETYHYAGHGHWFSDSAVIIRHYNKVTGQLEDALQLA